MKANNFIKKQWVIANDSSYETQKTGNLIGDGRFELIFLVGMGYKTIRDGKTETISEGIYIGGQMNLPMNLEIYPNTKLFSLKLEPWAVQLISGFNFSEALNKTVPLIEVNPILNKKLLQYNPEFQMNSIIQELLFFFEEQSKSANWNILATCCKILDSGYIDFKNARDNYVDIIGLSTRSIEQKFKRSIGLSPQQYANGIRLRRISEQIKLTSNAENFTKLAYQHGYFDQAHFNRLFKQYWGFSPKLLREEEVFITNSLEDFRYYTISSK